MLDDYFSMEIDKEGNLCSIPMLLEGYVPYLGNISFCFLPNTWGSK
jgi:hypothetical protein